MNIFVTGATGVLGRATVPALVRDGHHVRGVARGPQKAAGLRDAGAEPVAVDLFDPVAVKDVVAGADAVLHLATSIPPMKDMAKAGAWQTNDRLRTETTRTLVDAALDHGVRTFVAQSITFCYPDRGSAWIDESTPWGDEGALSSVVDLEREVARFAAGAGPGSRAVTLRFGSFYGPDARSVDEMLGLARKGLAPFLGAPDAYLSSIHVDDAGAAVVAALGLPAGTYNVCDEPVTRRAAAEAFAAAFGLRRPRFVPGMLQRAATRKKGDALLRSQRVSHTKITGPGAWAPAYRSVEEGWPAVAAARREAQQ